jgi:hypothetical protein
MIRENGNKTMSSTQTLEDPVLLETVIEHISVEIKNNGRIKHLFAGANLKKSFGNCPRRK